MKILETTYQLGLNNAILQVCFNQYISKFDKCLLGDKVIINIPKISEVSEFLNSPDFLKEISNNHERICSILNKYYNNPECYCINKLIKSINCSLVLDQCNEVIINKLSQHFSINNSLISFIESDHIDFNTNQILTDSIFEYIAFETLLYILYHRSNIMRPHCIDILQHGEITEIHTNTALSDIYISPELVCMLNSLDDSDKYPYELLKFVTGSSFEFNKEDFSVAIEHKSYSDYHTRAIWE